MSATNARADAPMTSMQVTESQRDVVTRTMVEVEKREADLMALAPKGYTAPMFYTTLRLYLASNEKVRQCNPMSIVTAMMRVAQTGLELGVSCDILPFKGSAMFSPRYNGLIELAHSAGVRSINHGVVRDGDLFEWELGSDAKLRHVPKAGNTGPITYAWACARIGITGMQIEVMDRAEIDALRREYSKSWSTGDLDAIPWYARKTVIRRICKYLPKNARFAAALRYDEIPDEDMEIGATTVRAGDEATGPTAQGEAF